MVLSAALMTLMAEVTLRVLHGADRGHVFEKLQTPITIGREEGNTIQLNDERISRFHVKIQEDHENIVLTDLESTNGTKVNGEQIQLRIMRYGDVINVGRSLLLYGTRDQIAQRLATLRKMGEDACDVEPFLEDVDHLDLEAEFNWGEDPDQQSTLHIPAVPELPQRLSPGQAAQLSELLEYLHLRIRNLIQSVKLKGASERVTLEVRQWQNLLDLQSRLAELLRAVSQPDEQDEEG